MIDLIHHVGIVVHSADDALGFFRDTMGLTVSEDRVIEEQGVRGVLLAIGENEIELIRKKRRDDRLRLARDNAMVFAAARR